MIVSDFNGNSKVVEDNQYFEEVRLARNLKDPNKNYHEISVSGYSASKRYDTQTNKGFSDIKYRNGKILFIGNWDQYDTYINWLVDNEGKLGVKLL